MDRIRIDLSVNGLDYDLVVPPHFTLLRVLREELGLTGAKEGCGGEGHCGACTVLLGGEPVVSCLMLAAQAQGREITTIEGLGGPDGLDPLQAAFVQEGAVQCGYCSPGMVMAAKGLLLRNPSPTREEIREGLTGNLCRCTGYTKILRAVEQASSGRRGGGDEEATP